MNIYCVNDGFIILSTQANTCYHILFSDAPVCVLYLILDGQFERLYFIGKNPKSERKSNNVYNFRQTLFVYKTPGANSGDVFR